MYGPLQSFNMISKTKRNPRGALSSPNDFCKGDEISFQIHFMIPEITLGCGGRAYLRVKIDF
jgi:hypothetical protein